jgi:hypothetical protein
MFLSALQAIRLKYLHPDSELQNFAMEVMDMLRADTSVDAHALVFSKQIGTFRLVFTFFSSIYEKEKKRKEKDYLTLFGTLILFSAGKK